MSGVRISLDDAELAYRVSGEGANVLLIQGVGLAGRAWEPQVEGLKAHFRVCAFDNRGMGDSTGTPTTVEAMADDAVHVMDALGWERAHVVGHSMGASIAQAMALNHRTRVASLACLCGLSRGSHTVRFEPRLLWHQTRCQIGTRNMRRSAFFRMVSPRALWGDVERMAQLEAVFGRELVALPKATMAQVGALRKFDVLDRLPELRVLSSFVLSATEDPIAPPREGAALAQALDTPFFEVPGSHAVIVQDAALVNQHLIRHFSVAS